jgi:predicted DNA-binding transcriptional regulator YafY
MGRRSAEETVIAIIAAFIDRKSWRQAELARRVGIQPAQLRKRLLELERQNLLPLEREEDTPQVFWSVPNNWYPGGLHLSSDDAQELLRQLARAPASEERDRLLVEIASASRREAPAEIANDFAEGHDESQLRLVEDAVAQHAALTLRYTSAHLGATRQRTVSVQRILLGSFPRFIAHCHESRELRYFRVSRIQSGFLDDGKAYVHVDPDDVDAFIASSVDGYRDPIAPVHVAFTVREPEVRWVADTAPAGLSTEAVDEGLRFSGSTAGVLALARFVVGLGAAARPETPELIAAVHNLAQGALSTSSPTIRSVPPIRSTGSESDLP